MNFVCAETFLTVIHTHTISQAANELYVSQSTVSGRIKQLEEELGVTLIERKKGLRGVELTEKGKQFTLLAERYVQLEKEIGYFQHEENEQHLTVAASSSVFSYMFTEMFRGMLNQETHLKLLLRAPSVQTIYQMVDTYEADIGFVFFTTRYDNVITRSLLAERMVLICSSLGQWPDRPLEPAELDCSHEISLRWSQEIERWHDATWDPSQRPYVRLEFVNMLDELLCTSPLAWAICSYSAALSLKKHNPAIQIRECAKPIPNRICYALTRRNASERSRQAVATIYQYLNPFIRQTQHFTRLP